MSYSFKLYLQILFDNTAMNIDFSKISPEARGRHFHIDLFRYHETFMHQKYLIKQLKIIT